MTDASTRPPGANSSVEDLVREIRRLLADRIGSDVVIGVGDDEPLDAAGVGSLDMLVVLSHLEQQLATTLVPDRPIEELLATVIAMASWIDRVLRDDAQPR